MLNILKVIKTEAVQMNVSGDHTEVRAGTRGGMNGLEYTHVEQRCMAN